MKTKIFILIIFLILSAIQLIVPSKMIVDYDKILDKGKTLKFSINLYTPNETYRNRDTFIYFKENKYINDTTKKWNRGEEVFVLLKYNALNSFAQIDKVTRLVPNSKADFVKATIDINKGDSISINYSFDRYLTYEPNSQKIEKLYKKYVKDSTQKCYALVSVIDGEAILKDVIINNKSINEIK